MRKLIENLRQKIRAKRLNVFLLFLALAFVISMLSKLSSPRMHTLEFELQPSKLPPQELLIQDPLPKVEVTITTSGFNLLKIAFQKRLLKIDFSTLQKDENTYYWSESNYRSEIAQLFGSNTTLESIRPALLTFKYATEFIKKVPVFINIASNFVVGYDLETPLKSQPDSIAIVGPKQYLEDINKISTKKITLNALKKDIEINVDLDVSNYPKYLKFSKTKVQVYGKVNKFTEGKIAVPVHLVNLPEHLTLSVFPKEIPVVFYTSLSAYNSIDRNDFRIECDYNALDKSSNVIIPKLISYPKSVKTAELQINSLEYVITKKND
ncbi:MAG: hypothetical protein ACON30_05670 [Flavobacteriaceae bacterium]